MAAVHNQVWTREIMPELFSGENNFMRLGSIYDQYVSGRTVNVPQSGVIPSVLVDNTTFPLTISQRTDTVESFQVKKFTTEPTHIEDYDEFHTTYDKRASVLKQHADKLNERMAAYTSNEWALDTTDTGRFFRTTGSAVGTALAPGATGTRNALIVQDFASAANLLVNDGFQDDEWYALVPSSMYYQLFQIDALIRKDFDGGSLPMGVTNKILDFNVIRRKPLTIYDAAGAKKAYGAASAVDDNLGVIFYAKSAVATAMARLKTYADEDNPAYEGSIFNTNMFMGAKILRTDLKGVGAIIQD